MPPTEPLTIEAHARLILRGQPPRSYVESAIELAQFILDNQLHLPGWVCETCRAFNGEAREELRVCRACGVTRAPEPIVSSGVTCGTTSS
jgi:hypothetical protein